MIFFTLLPLAQALYQCSKQVSDKLEIVSQTNEEVRVPLKDLFDIQSYKDVAIETQKQQFSVIPPLEQNEVFNTYLTPPTKLVSLKNAKDSNFKYSLNKLALLDQKVNQFGIYLTQARQDAKGRIQQFTTYYSQDSQKYDVTCFDLDFMNQDMLILDCSKPQVADNPVENVFFIYKFEDNQHQDFLSTSLNLGNYKQTTGRIFRISKNLMFRGYPSAGIEVGLTSWIEIYTLEQDKATIFERIDQIVLEQLLADETFSFKLIDFKVDSNGDLAILNADGTALHLSFSTTTLKWIVIKKEKPENGPFTSFDYDFTNRTFAYANERHLQYYYYNQFEFSEAQPNPRIFISNSHIMVITDTQLYQFQKNPLKLIDQTAVQGHNLVSIDKYQNDIAIYSTQGYKRYLLNNEAYLQYFSNIQLPLQVATISWNSQGSICKLQITNSVQLEGSNQIVKKRDVALFPYPIESQAGTLYISTMYEGPMIKIEVEKQDEVNIQVDSSTNQIMEDIFLAGKKVIYTSLYTDGYDLFLIQTDDLYVKVYKCYSLTTCTISIQFQSKIELNSANSQLAFFGDQYMIFLLESANKLTIQILDKKVTVDGEYSYTQILYHSSGLFALDQTGKSISLINIQTQKLQWKLNSQDVQIRGLLDWEPLRISCYRKEPILVVISSTSVALFSIDNQGYYLLYQYNQMNEFVEADAAVFNLEVIVTTRMPNKGIIFYAFKTDNLSNIRLGRRVQYNQFLYDVKMQFSFQYMMGLVHIFASSLNSKPVVVTFDFTKSSQSAPFTFQEFDQAVTLTADHFYRITVEPGQKVVKTFTHQYYSAFYQSNIHSEAYSKLVQLNVTVSNQDKDQLIKTKEEIFVVNKQTQIKMNTDNIDKNFKTVNKKNECFDQNSWIKGEIVDMSIMCPQCIAIQGEAPITVKYPLIEKQKTGLVRGLNIINLNTETIAVLYPDRAMLLSTADLHESKIQFLDTENCIAISSTQDGFFASCRLGTHYYIRHYVCNKQDCQLQAKSLETTTSYDKQITLINNFLILANDNQIVFYYLESGLNDLDKAVLKKTLQHSLISMEILSLSTDICTIFGIGNDSKFYLYSISIKGATVGDPSETSIELYDTLTHQGYYVQQTTNFNSIKLIKLVKGNPQFLITTQELAHFAIRVVLQCIADKCQIQENTLDFVLAPYGTYQLTEKPFIQIFDDYIALQYSYFSNLDNVVAVYNVKEPQDKQVAIAFLGAITNTSSTENHFVIYKNHDNQYQILCTTKFEQIFTQFMINDNFQICMKGEIDDQIITVTASNRFSRSTQLVDIRNVETDGGGSKWWIWVLVVIGIAAVGGAGYYCWKKRSQKQVGLLD